jgi:ammonia channel protein AmtB
LALIGVIILWFGWFGFNGGSELAWFGGSDDKVMDFSAVTVDGESIAAAEETLGITIDPASLVIVGTETVTISEVSFPTETADAAFGVSFADLSADVETTLPGTSSAVPGIIANTAVGGAAGLLAALALGWVLTKTPQVGSVGNGALAGLVAVTANCHSTTALSAVIIGAIGGVIAIGAEQLLLKVKIDDVVGAIPVHLAAGIWGTLAYALFAESSFLGDNSRMEQLVIQFIGVAAAAVWAGGGTFVVLYAINKVLPLRVSEEEEELGLNHEHGVAPMPPMGVPAAAGAMD